MALRLMIKLINPFSIEGVDRSIVHDLQKLLDRSVFDRGRYDEGMSLNNEFKTQESGENLYILNGGRCGC